MARQLSLKGCRLLLGGALLSTPFICGASEQSFAGSPPLVMAQAAEQQDAVVQLGQMEEQMRQLQGEIERLQYQNRQLQQRLDELGKTSSSEAAPPPPEGGQAAASGTAGSTSESAGAPGKPGTPTSGHGQQTLGTLPKSSFTEPSSEQQQQTAARAAAINPTAPAKQQYDAALQLMQQGQWDSARSVFQNITTRYPNDPLAPNAGYWLGETYYVSKDYQNAAATFAKNYRTYGPDAAKAPDTLLKLGMSLAANGDKDKACQIYGELDKRYPNASAAIKQTAARERATAKCS